MSFKLIGADDVSGGNAGNNTFILSRFQCVVDGSMTEFRIKSGVSGNVKCAIYTDNSGEPGALLTAMNTGQAVTGGQWNTLNFTSTQLVSGTYYWLAIITDTTGSATSASGGTMRYKSSAYSGFTFPDPAGSGFSGYGYYTVEAGWGDSGTAKNSTDAGSGTESVMSRAFGAAESGSGEEACIAAMLLFSGDVGAGLDMGGILKALFGQDAGRGADGVKMITGKAGAGLQLPPHPGKVNIPHKEVNL